MSDIGFTPVGVKKKPNNGELVTLLSIKVLKLNKTPGSTLVSVDIAASIDPHHSMSIAFASIVKTLRKRMVEASDYVGKDFPEEARRMHYGETEERNIYGESSLEDAKALLDEGIDILPLPVLPDEKN